MRPQAAVAGLLLSFLCGVGVHAQAPVAKGWKEVKRSKIVSQAFDLRGYYGWLHGAIALPSSVNVFLEPHAAASDPVRAFFALMDAPNFERMKAGYPPILLAAIPVGQPGRLEVPHGEAYWYGFVETVEKPEDPGRIPTSALGAAIYLLNAYQRQSHPPIRMTAEIYSVIEVGPAGSDALRPAPGAKAAPPGAHVGALEEVMESIAGAIPKYCRANIKAPDSIDALQSAQLLPAPMPRVAGYSFTLRVLNCGLWGVVAFPLSGKGPSFYLDEEGRFHRTPTNRLATRNDPVVPHP